MTKLELDLDRLTTLMDSEPDPNAETWLDLETGRPVTLSKKVLRAVDDDDYRTLNHLEARLRAEVGVAADILSNDPDRYALVPSLWPREVLSVMREFARRQEPGPIKDELLAACEGRGAFRRFRLALLHHPSVARAWEEHKRRAVLSHLATWLGELGYEPRAAAHL